MRKRSEQKPRNYRIQKGILLSHHNTVASEAVQQVVMASHLVLSCAVLLAVFLPSKAIPTINSFEKKLYEDLLVNRPIETHVRPVNESQDTISLKVGVTVIQISEVDEESESIKINGWLYLTWSDYNLQWNPSDYGGIDNIHVDPKKIWNPDLMVYNNADSRDSDVSFDTLTIVYHNGSVLWVPPTTFHTLCKMDVRFFPYDKQKCTIKLGSWTYHNKQIALELSKYDATGVLWENSEWKLEDMTAEKHSTLYPCCPDAYDDVEFTLELIRCASYFKITLVTPSIITMVLVLMLFYLPPSATERLQLGGLLGIFQMILLTNILWEVPHNGTSVPVIVLFNGVSLIFIGLSLALSIITWRLTHHSNRSAVPSVLQIVTNSKVTKILCLKTENRVSQDSKENSLDASVYRDNVDNEWFLVSAVLNRLFFIVYFFIYIILTAIVFM